MRMIVQVLAPGVQHQQQAELDAQALGVGGDVAQGPSAVVCIIGVVEQPGVGLHQQRPALAGNVNTTWKYSTGNKCSTLTLEPGDRARAWHLGQWRLRQEL